MMLFIWSKEKDEQVTSQLRQSLGAQRDELDELKIESKRSMSEMKSKHDEGLMDLQKRMADDAQHFNCRQAVLFFKANEKIRSRKSFLGRSRIKRTSKSISLHCFAPDAPILRSVRPKHLRNMSVGAPEFGISRSFDP